MSLSSSVYVDTLKQVPGPLLEFSQQNKWGHNNDSNSLGEIKSNNGVVATIDANKKPLIIVFIIGGLSLLEIAAFRHLSKDPYFPFQIVMATTCVINGKMFVDSFSERLSFNSLLNEINVSG